MEQELEQKGFIILSNIFVFLVLDVGFSPKKPSLLW